MEYAHYLHNFHSVSCQKNRAESLAARDAKWNKSSAAMPSRCAKNKKKKGGGTPDSSTPHPGHNLRVTAVQMNSPLGTLSLPQI